MRLHGLRLTALTAASCLLLACASDNNNVAGTGGNPGSGSGGSASGSGGKSGSGGATGTDAGFDVDNASLTWRQATLTDFTSYPDPGSVECIQFSGCKYEGMFAAFGREVKTEQWVMEHNIASVHEKDFQTYVGNTLRLRKDTNTIDVVVYDECVASDCSGCCTRNAMPSGFLIDIEKYTFMRFGEPDGPI